MDTLYIYDSRCEYRKAPLGLDCRKPRFSWKIGGEERNIKQKAYRIQVFRQSPEGTCVWDSGMTDSDQSVLVPYEGEPLTPETAYVYRIMSDLGDKGLTKWSDFSCWETGLMSPERWQADWIGPPKANLSAKPGDEDPCPYMRKSFSLTGKIEQARLHVSALGLYDIRLNGRKITDHLFTPGWTVYRKRLQYQTYDVTGFLNEGANAAAVILGNGWYKGYLGWEDRNSFFGDWPGLIFQLRLKYADGREEMILSDDSWKTLEGAIRNSELYHGETYIANREPEGWEKTGYNDSDWKGTVILDHTKEILIAQENIPVKRQEEITPIELITTPSGEKVLDFGQNMVGWVRFRVKGQEGDRVVLRHCEILDKEGNFYLGNIRRALQKIDYTLKGGEEETYEPTFTFQGFRYVRLDEFPESPELNQFTGIVVHSDMENAGTFSCDNEMVNQLQHNIRWGQKGNFLDVPTDCPQRDERLGWTGDAQVFAATACFNMNTALFFTKWLADLEAEQRSNGSVPETIPALPDLFMADDSGCGWGDAAVIVPWTLYLQYGDVGILKKQYASMKNYVEYIRSRAEDGLLWNSGFHFGDWLALDAKEGSYHGATPNDLTATAYYAYSTDLLRKAAEVLEKKEDMNEYANLHNRIIKAFREEFITPRGRIFSDTQTSHVLALHFNLTEERDRPRIIDSLVSHLEENHWHLSTGFLGTPYMCHALTACGRTDVAYKLLLQQDYPSWLYQVTKGATTIWEHWDGIKPDGSLWSDNMNSFNHYAYGAIGEWLYKTVAGIDTTEDGPGYQVVKMSPVPCKILRRADASHESPYGTIKSYWQIKDGEMEWSIVIPPNGQGKITCPFPGGDINEEYTGEIRKKETVAEFTLGSGTYRFRYPIDESQLPDLPADPEKKPWEQ